MRAFGKLLGIFLAALILAATYTACAYVLFHFVRWCVADEVAREFLLSIMLGACIGRDIVVAIADRLRRNREAA